MPPKGSPDRAALKAAAQAYSSGNYDEARKAAEDLLRAKPTYEAFLCELLPALSTIPTSLTSAEHACQCRLLGKAKFSLKDLQGSEQAYQEARALNAARSDAFRGLAEVHELQGEQTSLLEDYRALVGVLLLVGSCMTLLILNQYTHDIRCSSRFS